MNTWRITECTTQSGHEFHHLEETLVWCKPGSAEQSGKVAAPQPSYVGPVQYEPCNPNSEGAPFSNKSTPAVPHQYRQKNALLSWLPPDCGFTT
eukprot:4570086-Pyramimonas_sp.AAC.1